MDMKTRTLLLIAILTGGSAPAGEVEAAAQAECSLP